MDCDEAQVIRFNACLAQRKILSYRICFAITVLANRVERGQPIAVRGRLDRKVDGAIDMADDG
jgi:hypothetical protein